MGDADDSPLERGYRLHHGQRVAALATLLADRMHIDVGRDILYVGALLHDLGKSGGQPDKGHGERGAEITRDEISHLFAKEELNRVCSIVEKHYMRPNNLRFEGREVPEFADEVLLVQDADVLDHHGLFGVWLNMYWNAHERRSPSVSKHSYSKRALGNSFTRIFSRRSEVFSISAPGCGGSIDPQKRLKPSKHHRRIACLAVEPPDAVGDAQRVVDMN